MMTLKLGYRTRRPEGDPVARDYVEAIDPETQNDFENMMIEMVANLCHGEEKPSHGYVDIREDADTVSGPSPLIRLGYRTRRPEGDPVARDYVEAIDPETQNDFENMMIEMVANPSPLP